MAWLIFLALCVLFPVGIYCLFLAMINRRTNPTMISGSWDFAGVLLALSGFLLIGGPLLLAAANQALRSLWLRSESESAAAVGEYWWYIRVIFWALYFGAILAGSLYLLWKRGRVTSIYNVDSPALDEALARVLNLLHLKWARARNRVIVDFPSFPDGEIKGRILRAGVDSDESLLIPEREKMQPSGQLLTPSKTAVQSGEMSRPAVLEVDAFPSMHHVSLRWPQEAGPWRQEIEAELANTLLEVHNRDNPVGLWLLAIGSTLLCLIFFSLTILVLLSVLPRPG
jgi:hypothetical protein